MGVPTRPPTDDGDSVVTDTHNELKSKDYATDEHVESIPPHSAPNGAAQAPASDKTPRKQQNRGVEPFDQVERDAMERLLEELRGHLG